MTIEYCVDVDNKHSLAWFRFALYGKLIEELTSGLYGYIVSDIKEKEVMQPEINKMRLVLVVELYGKEDVVRID